MYHMDSEKSSFYSLRISEIQIPKAIHAHNLHAFPKERGYLTPEIAPPLCECSTGSY